MSTLSKLNKALEFQLDQLMNSDLVGKELEEEIRRNAAVTSVSREITSLHKLALEATKLRIEYGKEHVDDSMLIGGNNEKTY